MIEVRVWDWQKKRISRVHMILFDTEEIDHDDNDNEPIRWEHFDIMYYIGVKDRKGNKIFSGDIIKHNANLYLIEKHENLVDGWATTLINSHGLVNQSYANWLPRVSKYIDRLGNKYENPELLKCATSGKGKHF